MIWPSGGANQEASASCSTTSLFAHWHQRGLAQRISLDTVKYSQSASRQPGFRSGTAAFTQCSATANKTCWNQDGPAKSQLWHLCICGRAYLGCRLFTHKLFPQVAQIAGMHTELHNISGILHPAFLLRYFSSHDAGMKLDGRAPSLANGISIPMENPLILCILQAHLNTLSTFCCTNRKMLSWCFEWFKLQHTLGLPSSLCSLQHLYMLASLF